MDYLFRRKLGARYPEYELYNNLLSKNQLGWKVDVTKLGAWVIALSMLGNGALIAFGLNAHTRFTEEAIMIKTGWALGEKAYPYDQVRAVAKVKKLVAPSGNVTESPHQAILFEDGTTWTTGDGFWTSGPIRDKQIMEFVALKARKPIQEVDLIEQLGRRNRGGAR